MVILSDSQDKGPHGLWWQDGVDDEGPCCEVCYAAMSQDSKATKVALATDRELRCWHHTCDTHMRKHVYRRKYFLPSYISHLIYVL